MRENMNFLLRSGQTVNNNCVAHTFKNLLIKESRNIKIGKNVRLYVYLLYMRISGFQRDEGGILTSWTLPYSDSFQARLTSIHSLKINN